MQNPIKILFLEDNISDIELTERAIAKAFPECIFHNAKTIAEANKLLQNEKNYDLMLLDLNLPDGSGLDILTDVRQKNMPTAVIILTIEGDEEIAITALKAGADDYMVKTRGYLLKLPEAIKQAVKNFKKSQKYKSQIINVLYVEWHESDIDFTKRHFSQHAPNLKIKAVPDAITALKLLPKSEAEPMHFDILLMDYHLPGINALEAVKTIRQERKLSIPIVIVTGQGNEEVAVQALKLGVDEYLVKRENYLLRLPSMLLNAYQKHQLEMQQKELQKSKEEYQSFFEDDLTGDFISTIEGKLLNCNPAYLEICGFSSKEEALNYDIRKIYVKSDTRATIIERLKKDGRVISYEADLKRPDGKVAHVIGNMVGGFDTNGQLITLKGYIFDNTKRKVAEDQLRKLSVAVEQSPATVIMTDINGNIEYVNKKFTEVTGYSQNEVIGKNPRIFNSGNQSKELYEHLWQNITSGKEWFGEMLNKKKDGSLYWEQASISPIIDENGKITHFLGVKEDITEKKENEIKLIKALEKSEESDKLKTAFLHNISHEIRTPMNAIIGFSNFLKDPELSFERKNKYTDIVIKSGEQLLSIITDIINIATIETGQEKISEKEINLNSLFKLVYEQFKEKILAKNIDFNVQLALSNEEDDMIIDETKLLKIITSLVGNALKFTSKGFINMGYKVKENQLEIYVEDSGIGIPANMYEEIFDRFTQAEKTNTRFFGGSGLGLSISKGYAELLGGKISLVSEINKGSIFYVSIPFKKALKKDLLNLNVIYTGVNNLEKLQTILVAEDEDLNFMLIEELLSDSNMKILRAENGMEAIDLFKSNQEIDLVLMDIKMPVMNGIDATKEIRKFALNLPIIAQTAYSTTGDMQLIKEAGCNDILIKPFNREDLMAKISEFLMKVKS